jgi:hypothetical protein
LKLPDPLRLKILKALTVTLEEVRPVNGYTHDLLGKVFRGRTRYGKEDPLPMISILEAPIPLDPILSRNTNTDSSGMWELLIQGFIKDDIKHPTDPAHLLMAEVKSVLVKQKKIDRGNNIFGMAGRVVEMFVGQGSVRPSDEASDKGYFWLTLSLRIAEDLENPYS